MAYFHCLIGGGSSGGGYELTVTCDAQFAGTTITCTDGVTTLTQTCPSASPYEVVFEIPNGGDWTISGVVSGQTISAGVNIPTSVNLDAIIQQTVTIYSAKEDTITYTDIYGDTQTEVFASGQISKQITIDVIASGSSITFTSGVAKNPSDLTANYSKTVTIASNTTDVWLMPNNVIYWYGYENNFVVCNYADGWTTWAGTNNQFGSVTKYTNSLNINAVSGLVTAVGNANAVSGSKAHAIGYANNATFAYFTIQQTKAIKASSTALAATSFTTSNSHIEISYDFTDAYITPQNAAQNGYITYLYAFWYE